MMKCMVIIGVIGLVFYGCVRDNVTLEGKRITMVVEHVRIYKSNNGDDEIWCRVDAIVKGWNKDKFGDGVDTISTAGEEFAIRFTDQELQEGGHGNNRDVEYFADAKFFIIPIQNKVANLQWHIYEDGEHYQGESKIKSKYIIQKSEWEPQKIEMEETREMLRRQLSGLELMPME